MKLKFFRQKVLVLSLSFFAALFVVGPLSAKSTSKSAALMTPAGYWQTIDHDTKKPSSVIKIWRTKSGVYNGRIHYIYSEAGHQKSDVCRKCKGKLHNRPILGMQIINHFHKTDDPNFYNKGRIMDPTNGKTYKCHMTLKQNGQVLDVHGYIGIPLFGRSDIWYRVHKIK